MLEDLNAVWMRSRALALGAKSSRLNPVAVQASLAAVAPLSANNLSNKAVTTFRPSPLSISAASSTNCGLSAQGRLCTQSALQPFVSAL